MKTNNTKIWETEFKEDFSRKDWTSEDWMQSKEHIDRLIWLISSFSPHNLWKAREALRGYAREEYERGYQAARDRYRQREGFSNQSLIKEIESLETIHKKAGSKDDSFSHGLYSGYLNALTDIKTLISCD